MRISSNAVSDMKQTKATACDRCPFRLLRNQSVELSQCTDCNQVTAESIARFGRQARRLARRGGVKGPSIAEDVVGELALLIAETSLADRFDPQKGTPEAFVCGINRRTSNTLFRQFRKHRRPVPGFAVRHVSDDPQVCATYKESGQIVRAAVAELPPRYREAICSAYGISDPSESPEEGMPATQPINHMVLFLARRRLRQIIMQKFPDSESLF